MSEQDCVLSIAYSCRCTRRQQGACGLCAAARAGRPHGHAPAQRNLLVFEGINNKAQLLRHTRALCLSRDMPVQVRQAAARGTWPMHSHQSGRGTQSRACPAATCSSSGAWTMRGASTTTCGRSTWPSCTGSAWPARPRAPLPSPAPTTRASPRDYPHAQLARLRHMRSSSSG